MRRASVAAAIAAGVAIAAIGFLLWRRNAGTGAADGHSVAVLALDNVGNDSKNEYFSDGLTDELTTALDRVPGLRVASRTSAFSFKGKHGDARDIARSLGVGSLLEGSVRRDGTRMHVAVRLTSARDGLTLWSSSYERSIDDVFAVQDSIALAVARALSAGGGARGANASAGAAAGSSASAGSHGTSDVEAYDLYLRGRYFWRQRGDAALRHAAVLFEQAIARDQGFARAYAGLADALALLPVYGSTPADSVSASARQAALRALALDSTLADAYTTLGLVQRNAGEWTESAKSLARAIALDPRDATPHQWLGELLVVTDDSRGAVAAMRDAARLEPTSPIIAAELCYALALDRQYAEAEAAGRRAIALQPDVWTGHAFLGFAYQFAGDHVRAVAELERAQRLSPQLPALGAALAYAYASPAVGRRAAADSIVRVVVAQAATPAGSAYAASIADLAVGKDAEALDWLDRAARARDPWLLEMSFTGPWFERVRGNPRLAEIGRRLGLSDNVGPRADAPKRSGGQ